MPQHALLRKVPSPCLPSSPVSSPRLGHGHPFLRCACLCPGGPDPALSFQVACEFGLLRVVSRNGGIRGKDYCILYNPQWAHLPRDLSKVVSGTCAFDLQSASCHSPGPPQPGFSCCLRAVGSLVRQGPHVYLCPNASSREMPVLQVGPFAPSHLHLMVCA